MSGTDGPTLDAVVVAGHTGDESTARSGVASDDTDVRTAALGALARLGRLDASTLVAAARDAEPGVRRRAAELLAARPDVALDHLLTLCDDPDPVVVEMAAWACGEREDPAAVPRLVALAGGAADPLVREAAAAALGAIGHVDGFEAVLAACRDVPAVRRRAVLALAPFLDRPAAGAALRRARDDRDWQVRQAAEDLLRVLEGTP